MGNADILLGNEERGEWNMKLSYEPFKNQFNKSRLKISKCLNKLIFWNLWREKNHLAITELSNDFEYV